MAEPKKKLSKTRTNRRRATYKASATSATRCSNCGAVIAPHQVCPKCGFYKGARVLPTQPKERIVVENDQQ